MAGYELRQRLRDRSVFIFGLLVPLALMAVTNLTVGSVDDLQLQRIDVGLSAPEGDPLAEVVVDAALRGDAVDVSLQEGTEEEVRRLAEDGEVALGLIIPPGFGDAVTSGQGVVVDAIEGEGSGIETDVVLTIVQSVLDEFTARATITVAGLHLGLDPAEAQRVAEQAASAAPTLDLVEVRATDEQLDASGTIVAGQAGLFLLFTVGFGVLGLLTEREQGTLVRLRSMPMRPGLIVASKGLVSYILGVVATAVLLIVGSLAFGVDFGRPDVVAVLVVCAVAAATSLMFIVARVARTAEQANVMQSILAIVLGMAGGAFFTIPAEGTLGRVLDLNPISAFVRGLGISSGGGGLGDVSTQLAIMLGFALLCVAISLAVPDRGTRL